MKLRAKSTKKKMKRIQQLQQQEQQKRLQQQLQQQRVSERKRKRSEKGKLHDEYMEMENTSESISPNRSQNSEGDTTDTPKQNVVDITVMTANAVEPVEKFVLDNGDEIASDDGDEAAGEKSAGDRLSQALPEQIVEQIVVPDILTTPGNIRRTLYPTPIVD